MTVGSKLKEKREELGLSLASVSEKTKIQERYLIALEDDRFDAVPGDYYLKDFIGKYAELLKLDATKLLAEVAQQKEMVEQDEDTEVIVPVAAKPMKPEISMVNDEMMETVVENEQQLNEEMMVQPEMIHKAPLNKNRVAGAIIVVLALLGLGAYGISLLNQPSQSGVTSEQTSTQATETTKLKITETTSSETTETSSTENSETTTGATTKTEETESQTTQAVQTTPSSTTQNTTVSTPTVAGSIYTQSSQPGTITYGLAQDWGNYNGQYVFELSTKEPTWVKVTIHGKTVLEKTIPAMNKYTVVANNNAANVDITVGISSSVSLTMNGRPVYFPTDSRVQHIIFDLRK